MKKDKTPEQPIVPRLLDPRWPYTPANKTDVTNTWRKHGWKPAAERQKK